MEDTMPRLLIEATVRQALKNLRDDPKRSIRNLVDMALQFSEGRFQNNFFEAAHTMLKDPDSAYYALVADASRHIETEHLVRFGMNLGYNSCTWGAKHIRANEKALGFNIPWMVLLETGETDLSSRVAAWQAVIAEGERLGTYAWGLFCRSTDPTALFPLIQQHPDSAFFLFCPPQAVTDALTETIAPLHNLMLVPGWGGECVQACAKLRRAKLPYSLCIPYSPADLSFIESGEAFRLAQQLHALFTVLLPLPGCPAGVRSQIYAAAVQARNRQFWQTVPWDVYYDTCRLDTVISDDPCWACFDAEGDLRSPDSTVDGRAANLFRDGLTAVLRQTYPKRVRPVPIDVGLK